MSGAGTNAGIEYQQRVASLLLAYQYGELDISSLIGCNRTGHISETRFETDSPIDDIAVLCAEGWRAEFQVKRSLPLSEAPDSDFAGVLLQFVKRFVADRKAQISFTLVTTSNASAKIRYELRKILESIRLNDTGFLKNPLNKSEKETFNLFSRLFEATFFHVTKIKPTLNDFTDFAKRTFVAVIDVEAGMTLEKAALLILNGQGFAHPELVWGLLIKNSLHYATERMSISRDALGSLLNEFKATTSNNANAKPGPSELIEQFKSASFACGKEVLAVKSFDSNSDYMVLELFRFDEAGQKKVLFRGNQLILGKGEIRCDVVFRCATMTGLQRFFELAGDTFTDARIVIMPATGIDDVESSEAARLYGAYCEQLAEANTDPEKCLHCSKDALHGDFPLVEVDESGLQPAVGIIHPDCRRPLDRVLGLTLIQNEPGKTLPDAFNLSAWIKASERGQGLMNSFRGGLIPRDRNVAIAWSSDSEYDADYRFCVKFVLANGSERYSSERGRILRVNRAQAEFQLKRFQDGIRRQREANDPLCYTSKSFSFGTYSLLLQTKPEDEEIVEIISAEVAPYTELLSKVQDTCENYYAPMGLVRDIATETQLCFSGIVPFISNPLRFREFEKNWCDAGFGCEALTLKVIKDDRDFDGWMRTIFGDGLVPIIDPLFDKNQNLVSGLVIQHQEAMIMAAEMQREAGGSS